MPFRKLQPVRCLHLDMNVLGYRHHVLSLALAEHVLVDNLHLNGVAVLILTQNGDYVWGFGVVDNLSLGGLMQRVRVFFIGMRQ